MQVSANQFLLLFICVGSAAAVLNDFHQPNQRKTSNFDTGNGSEEFQYLPSSAPSLSPSIAPSEKPSGTPTTTTFPSSTPSEKPSGTPTATTVPSSTPSDKPSGMPTTTVVLSSVPSEKPSGLPTATVVPSSFPSETPSGVPTTSPQPSTSPNPTQQACVKTGEDCSSASCCNPESTICVVLPPGLGSRCYPVRLPNPRTGDGPDKPQICVVGGVTQPCGSDRARGGGRRKRTLYRPVGEGTEKDD